MRQELRQQYANLTRSESVERDTFTRTRAELLFMTKHMDVWSPCGDHRELSFTEKENVAGGLTVLVPDNEHWGSYFYGQSRRAMRPIVTDLPGWRNLWITVSFTRTKVGRERYIEVSAVHALEYLNWMRIWPDPWLPPEFQPSKWRSPIGPAATVCADLLIPELQRLQGGFWPIMTHARFHRSPDPTPWTMGSYRMDKAMDAVTEICDAENLQITTQLYMHGVDEQPFPQWHVLDRTTLIIDFVPRINSKSLTGTVTGGLIRTGLEIAEDLIEWVTYPVLDPSDPVAIDEMSGRDGEVFPVYRTGQWSPTDEVSQTVHLPMATRVTAGGNSPGWVNDVAVGVVDGVITFIAGFLNLDGFLPGSIADRVSDVALAFHSLEDQRAAEDAGPWRLREAFSDSQQSGLSLQIVQSMKSTAFAHRDYTSHSVTVANGQPYLLGRHVKVGWPVGVEMPDGTVEVDRLTEATYTESRDTKGEIVLQVGSGDAEVEPGVKGLAKISKFSSWLHRVSLGG